MTTLLEIAETLRQEEARKAGRGYSGCSGLCRDAAFGSLMKSSSSVEKATPSSVPSCLHESHTPGLP